MLRTDLSGVWKMEAEGISWIVFYSTLCSRSSLILSLSVCLIFSHSF